MKSIQTGIGTTRRLGGILPDKSAPMPQGNTCDSPDVRFRTDTKSAGPFHPARVRLGCSDGDEYEVEV
jgi:hypothetical protein